MRPGRLHRLTDASSQWLNVALFDGDANHSISGDAHRFRRVRLQRTIDWIFERLPGPLREDEHCRKSHDADVQRGCALCRSEGGQS